MAYKTRFRGLLPRAALAAVIALFVVISLAALHGSRAATPYIAAEPENGTLASCAVKQTDQAASGGAAINFAGDCTGSGTRAAGAVLPVRYDLASLGSAVRYVALNGNDASGNGTSAAPYATLGKAVSAAVTGDSIVVHGGTYRQGNVTIPAAKSLKVIAYPGETPVFSGAQPVDGGWISEGGLRFISYTPRPATDGSGISFTTGQNLTGDGIGKYADQAWTGDRQLRQVSAKSSVVSGTFFVDRTANRLYMTTTDSGQANVQVSGINVFINVQSPLTTIEGLRIMRYSNTASDYGVVKFQGTADNSTMRNVEVTESAFIAVLYDGSGNINTGARLQNVSVSKSNWMGISANITDGLTLDSVKLTDMNQFGEFTFSPQSGALKTSRTNHTKVLSSEISGNNSNGLWFDQSNYDVQVANNTIFDNDGSTMFFEISDNLLLINNYIRSTGTAKTVKLVGSSGLKLINNTIVGGSDPIGIYTDNRSIPGCANPSQPLCANSYGSDRDTIRTYRPTMDWMPRLDLMLNNIIAYPTAPGYCGGLVTLCITQSNGTAAAALQTEIHKAEAGRGIPQTVFDGNVYANGTEPIIKTNNPAGRYLTVRDFAPAMAGGPVSISGFEPAGRSGNTLVNADGSPTAELAAAHGAAAAVPVDQTVNQYIPAGTRHYGIIR